MFVILSESARSSRKKHRLLSDGGLLCIFLELYPVEFMRSAAELAASAFRFDNGLIARPEEIAHPDKFNQPAALHHVTGIVM